MLPGKKLKPEDFLAIAWRRRWQIVVPLVLVAFGAAVLSLVLPNRYQSEALIQIIPPRISDKFVAETVDTSPEERVQAIRQQVLTRARLERLIQEFNLYEHERRTSIMQDVVDRMRDHDITVDIPKARRRPRGEDIVLTFRVAFQADSARSAVQVTERLASMFIEEGLRDRSSLAEGTDRFLQAQLDEARRQLIDTERRIEEYNRANVGALPTQLQTNLQLLQATQTQLQTASESLLRDRDQRVVLERLLGEALTAPPTAAPAPGGKRDDDATPATAAAQLEAARKELAALRLRLKPEHPDLIRAERVVRNLEARAAEEALTRPLGPAERPAVAADPARQKRVDDLRSQIASLDVQMASKQREQDRLRALLSTYQARVEATPGRESELVSLTRDYETLKDRYNSLLSKREDARIAADVERREIGEQFRLLDPPRTPERPFSPDRVRINLLGALLGLALGLALAGLLEYRDSTFRSESDIVSTLALPVLALVPVIKTAADLRRERQRRVVVSVAMAVVLVVIGTAAALVWRAGLGGA